MPKEHNKVLSLWVNHEMFLLILAAFDTKRVSENFTPLINVERSNSTRHPSSASACSTTISTSKIPKIQ